jgi:RNA polymerase sigma-70 factor, ECF subfamily
VQPEGEFLQPDQLDRLRGRQPVAVDAEYRAHQDVLTRAARRLGFASVDADELTQSVWTTFLEVVPRFEGRSQVRTFLLGILRREAASARRQASRTGHSPTDDICADLGDCSSQAAKLESAELRRAVHRCVGVLRAKERQAVELKLLAEKDTSEVERALGVTANYLGVLLHRARDQLRHCLEEHW